MYPIITAAMEQLGESRRVSIRNALASYMREVEERNLTKIHTSGRKMMKQPTDAKNTEEENRKQKIEYFAEEFILYKSSIKRLPTSLEQYLHAPWPEDLVELWSLHGIVNDPVDLGKREMWFSSTQNVIDSLALSGMSCPQSLPADLVYLACLVKAINGPGLPRWRDTQQVEMISSTEERDYQFQLEVWPCDAAMSPSERFETDREVQFLDYVWRDWKKSVAFQIGANDTFGGAGSYAVFCRRLRYAEHWDHGIAGDDGETRPTRQGWKDSDLVWQWRFGLHAGAWHSPLFDTVEEYLAWYADCKDPVEKISSLQVFQIDA